MKKLFTLLLLFTLFNNSLFAQEIPASAWGNMPALHVEGRHLVDEYGNNVVLHGVMDTPSPWFNSYVDPNTNQEIHNIWGGVSDANIGSCLKYFNQLFTAITDTTQGAYCNVFRLHLDPCWTNDNSVRAPGFKESGGKTYDPNGTEVGGEANIYHFSEARFKNYFEKVYLKIAKQAVAKGLYVIMRPPGVFPGTVKVGDYYNQYIMKVWDIVTQNAEVKRMSGQIMIELGNEPVSLKNAKGQDDDKALCDFFQPVVDKMRANGYEGVIWGVGTGWQGNTRPYGKYPLVGKNIGYAVHNYVGWYGGDDKNFSVWGSGPYAINSDKGKAAYAQEFHNSHPIMDTNPIVITEVDWSPVKAGTGHYNEHGNWVESNYGTWATGTTSGWGAAYKYLLDKYDNISMTLSGTACYINIYDYIKQGRKVTPAFKTAMEKNGLDPWEGSGVACFAWYKEWAKENYARPDLSEVTVPLKEFTLAQDNVTCMVGQKIDFGAHGVFEDGMTSNIPTSLLDVEVADKSVCDKVDGSFMALAEGTTTMKVSYKSGKDVKDCEVNVLPAFSLAAGAFNPSISLVGSYTERTSAFNPAAGGIGGWVYDAGIDVSDYNYLVVNLRRSSQAAPVLRIYDTDDCYADCYSQNIGTSSSIKVDLKAMKKSDGTPLDLKNIKIVGIKAGNSSVIYLKEVFLSMDGENPVSISAVADANVLSEEYFNAAGMRIAQMSRGINIVRQHLSDGTTKTFKINVSE